VHEWGKLVEQVGLQDEDLAVLYECLLSTKKTLQREARNYPKKPAKEIESHQQKY